MAIATLSNKSQSPTTRPTTVPSAPPAASANPKSPETSKDSVSLSPEASDPAARQQQMMEYANQMFAEAMKQEQARWQQIGAKSDALIKQLNEGGPKAADARKQLEAMSQEMGQKAESYRAQEASARSANAGNPDATGSGMIENQEAGLYENAQMKIQSALQAAQSGAGNAQPGSGAPSTQPVSNGNGSANASVSVSGNGVTVSPPSGNSASRFDFKVPFTSSTLQFGKGH